MTDGTHIALEDLAQFAMHCASEQEAAAIEAHFEQCPLCRAEFEKLSTELAMVAMSVDQHPLPAGARERFIDRITAAPKTNSPSSVLAMPQQKERAAFTVWIPWALAAALALLAVTMGVRINSLNRELRNQSRQIAEFAATESRAQQVLDVLTARESQHIVLTTSKAAPVPTARAVYLPSRGGLIFQASNMGPLPDNKTYELWVIPADGSAPIPAGLFRPDASGSASIVLPPLPPGVAAKAFGVTIERAEGSSTPTAPIILAGAASAS
jgi:hypothetical protein